MHKKHHTSTSGFTLVELAIALMVIGLLIGGVLKGQELIENARITATIRQFKAYETAAMIFRNTYGALPGDIKRPNRIPNCNTDDNSTCGLVGNGNGKIESGGTENEQFNFFQHLTKAGMIQGPEGGTTTQRSNVIGDARHQDSEWFFPETPLDTRILRTYYVDYSTISRYTSTHYYYIDVTGKQASALDEKLDDGNSQTGSVHPDDPSDCVEYDEDAGAYTVYNIQNGICADFMIGAGF